MSAESPNQPINWEAISALAGYEDDAIRNLYGETGAQMREEDIQNVRGLAMDLAASATERKSPEDFLRTAMREARKVGGEMIRNLSDGELRDTVKQWSGQTLTDEEIKAFRVSTLGLDDWLHERAGIKGDMTTEPYDVAVDRTGNVVAQGTTSEEALKHARDLGAK